VATDVSEIYREKIIMVNAINFLRVFYMFGEYINYCK